MINPPDEDWSQPLSSQFLVHTQEVDLNLTSDNVQPDLFFRNPDLWGRKNVHWHNSLKSFPVSFMPRDIFYSPFAWTLCKCEHGPALRRWSQPACCSLPLEPTQKALQSAEEKFCQERLEQGKRSARWVLTPQCHSLIQPGGCNAQPMNSGLRLNNIWWYFWYLTILWCHER